MKNTHSHVFKGRLKAFVLALASILILSSPIVPAYAYQSPGKPNTGTIVIKSSTGTIPGTENSTYSAMDGDTVTYSIILCRLLSPDYLNIEFGQGIDFQEVVATSVYSDSPFGEMDWEINGVDWSDENIAKIDLSDLPDYVDQLTIQIKCGISGWLAGIYDGSSIKATYFSKQPDMQQEFVSPKIYGLHMWIKTIDSSSDTDTLHGINNVVYQLYYNEEMSAAVNFSGEQGFYTACPTTNDNGVCDLEGKSGTISLKGLREGTYYLAQIRDGECTDIFPVQLTGNVKFDPDDPSNKKKERKKEKKKTKGDPEISEATRKVFEQRKLMKELEEAAKYHADHPREYVSAVKLSKSTPDFISVAGSAAGIIWDCNPNLPLILGVKKEFILLCGCVGFAVGFRACRGYRRSKK